MVFQYALEMVIESALKASFVQRAFVKSFDSCHILCFSYAHPRYNVGERLFAMADCLRSASRRKIRAIYLVNRSSMSFAFACIIVPVSIGLKVDSARTTRNGALLFSYNVQVSNRSCAMATRV